MQSVVRSGGGPNASQSTGPGQDSPVHMSLAQQQGFYQQQQQRAHQAYLQRDVAPSVAPAKRVALGDSGGGGGGGAVASGGAQASAVAAYRFQPTGNHVPQGLSAAYAASVASQRGSGGGGGGGGPPPQEPPRYLASHVDGRMAMSGGGGGGGQDTRRRPSLLHPTGGSLDYGQQSSPSGTPVSTASLPAGYVGNAASTAYRSGASGGGAGGVSAAGIPQRMLPFRGHDPRHESMRAAR
ncbi:unnamed protein product [Notodromas monacha]|uniref:Uncharacterized protein n=1 Tax=Notodromas monacha TaxID=399045 RepID=A0A7R9GII6_9CRUS|nr:unnamed protein product [Notodromas monacha]CAG0921814.1 unnamed protein product [Notodromas monacha]